MATLSFNNKGTSTITVLAQLDSGSGASTKTMKWFYRRSGDQYWTPDGSTTGTEGTQSYYHTFSGLTSGVSYDLNCDFYTSGTFNVSLYVDNITTDAAPPIGTPSISVGVSSGRNVSVSWSSVSQANRYKVYVNNYNGSGDVLKYDGPYTSTSFSVDSEFHRYYVKVVPYNGEVIGSPNTQDFTTLDETDPVANSFYVSGVHADSMDVVATGYDVTPSYSSNNGQSGLNGYWFYISYDGGANWSFCKQILTTGTGYYTYKNGVDGVSMAANVNYTFGVRAIDVSGRSSTILTCSGKTAYNRPNNWVWTTSKIASGDYSMLADEWNSFTSRINDFLLYKAVITTRYVFQTAYTGNDFLAAMYNDVANQINRMTPVYYTTKYRDDSVQADDLNYLMDRLNSVA